MARKSWFTSVPAGMNRGSIVLNMNRMVINGTERNSSMNSVENIAITGRFDRRPSASMIPAIVGNFIGLFKDTTLVSIIGLFDLMNMARAIGEDTDWLGLFIEPFFVVSLIYFVFCFAMSSYSIGLEKKLAAGRDR